MTDRHQMAMGSNVPIRAYDSLSHNSPRKEFNEMFDYNSEKSEKHGYKHV